MSPNVDRCNYKLVRVVPCLACAGKNRIHMEKQYMGNLDLNRWKSCVLYVQCEQGVVKCNDEIDDGDDCVYMARNATTPISFS